MPSNSDFLLFPSDSIRKVHHVPGDRLKQTRKSHKLKEIDLVQRITICDPLLKSEENYSFLKRIITGDEKWIIYNRVKRKRSWSRKEEPSQSTANSSKEGDALCMVRLERNYIFRVDTEQASHQFGRVLSSTG